MESIISKTIIMEVTGRIKMIDQTKEVGSAGFKKRDVVVTTDEQYPQHILVQFVQDKCDLLNNFQVGDAVKIDINLRGREWTNPQGEVKYFNTLDAWKVQVVTSSTMAHVQNEHTSIQKDVSIETQEDDLPF